MGKKAKKTRLIQIHASPPIWRRFLASPEFNVHRTISGTLRAILDKALPTVEEIREMKRNAV